MQSVSHPRKSFRTLRAARQVINLDEPALVWQINHLRMVPHDWIMGFPYFGDASELLEQWGLYSRSVVLRVLVERVQFTLGDKLCHHLVDETSIPTLYLADLNFRRLHCLREVQ